tara:strand:- start:30749 stop:32119 length:1371 start_codon:yes stop_codon:yes gene_type:complete
MNYQKKEPYNVQDTTALDKVILTPIYFKEGRDEEFDIQLSNLKRLLDDKVIFLNPTFLGSDLPVSDAVVFPQLLGQAFKHVEDFKNINMPILILTSEFGTVSMWDWEIINYLKNNKVQVLAPSNFEEAKLICKCLNLKKELTKTKFLVYQDNPGEGQQASIFKRFFWWEEECIKLMEEKFGIITIKKSYQELGNYSKNISDSEARLEVDKRHMQFKWLPEKSILSAIKLYMAVEKDINEDPSIKAVGINCLNESHFSDTTPCLSWDILFNEKEIIWGCEADIVSMLTELILWKSLEKPFMMTNMYPFLMGHAALKHEKITSFPEVESHPENHILVAHCGFLGVIPTCFATNWELKPKVLDIVNSNAVAIDGQLPLGNINLVKFDSTLNKLSVIEGELIKYAQFPNSHCLSGGVIKIRDGYELMDRINSHHYIIMEGNNTRNIKLLSNILGCECEII